MLLVYEESIWSQKVRGFFRDVCHLLLIDPASLFRVGLAESYPFAPAICRHLSQHRADTISEVGDSGPKVIDVDMWWEFQRMLQNALIDTQISINIKAKRAADCVYFCNKLASIFTCCLYLFLWILVDTGGWIGGRNEMPQHSTALLFPSSSPTHLGWPFHFRVQQMER